MAQTDEWAEQLEEAESKIAEVYAILAALRKRLKEEGQKQDAQALGEAVERLARYGRLFQDMRASWADPDR
jgi:molecular chaperone GrpE (heat shock protein)